MFRLSATAAALILASTLGACGQNGPLYMPGNPSQITTTPPQPVERTIETPEDDDAADEDRKDRDGGDSK